MEEQKTGLHRVGGWGSGRFLRFWLVMEGGERDLSSVEELVGSLLRNRLNEDAMCRAGDEVADTFITGQRGHGFAVSGAGLVGGEDRVRAAPFRTLHVRIVGALPSGAASLDGSPGLLGVEVECRERNGLDEGEFGCGFWGHDGFSLHIVFPIGA